MIVGQSRVTIVCCRSAAAVTGQQGTSGHVSAIMTTMGVVLYHESKLQAPMGSDSSGVRPPLGDQVSLRTYSRVLHHWMLGQLTLACHHIIYHDIYR